MTEADGIGPGYCKACKIKRDTDQACGGCPEPLVWDENAPAVELFLLCETQWKRSQSGLPLGLDYPAVRLVARVFKFVFDADLLGRLQVLEREFIKVRCDSVGSD